MDMQMELCSRHNNSRPCSGHAEDYQGAAFLEQKNSSLFGSRGCSIKWPAGQGLLSHAGVVQ